MPAWLVLWFTESTWAWRWHDILVVVQRARRLLIGNLMIHVYMGVFAERVHSAA